MSSNESSVECLTFGFVRETIQDIDGWDIIPFDVIGLCHLYYTVQVNIFLFCGYQYGKDISLNGMLCVNMNEKKRIKFNIYNVESDENDENDDDKQQHENEEAEDRLNWEENETNPKDATLTNDWHTIKSGYCYTNNLDLPSFIINKYSKLKDQLSGSKLCGIFKCGGRQTSTFNRITNVSSIIFKAKDINWRRKENDAIINAYHLKLPSTPIAATVECLCSAYYGLYNIYDGSKCVWRLPFDKWQWIKMNNMNYTHYKGSLCVVNGIDRYNEKLFICGGYRFDGNKCEMLDVYNKKWHILPNLLYKVTQSGIKYDFCKNRIYIGGGSRAYSRQRNSSNLSSYYDVIKNKWYKLAKTNYEHSHHPLIFINDRQPNILYICGNDQHDIGFSEYLDLRRKKEWEIVNNDGQLHEYFNKKDVLIKRLCA